MLKPLKGCEPATEDCLRSWFAQQYTGRVQILFGVASAEDSACGIVRKLQREFPDADSQLIVCSASLGANAKVSKLIELERLAKHDLVIISDADVSVPPDLIATVIEPLRVSSGKGSLPAGTDRPDDSPTNKVGLVNCFYRLANPATLAMQWEAIAVNADFWSQVLQSQSLKPIDFALGAVMALPRKRLEEIGGFARLKDFLADDYQLGHRIAQGGYRIALASVVVDCWSAPMNWTAVWKHQLRWARTIRVSQPAPYFFSILSNATLWPLVWLLVHPTAIVLGGCFLCWLGRILAAVSLQQRLTLQRDHQAYWWMIPIKDLFHVCIWSLAFIGNTIEWRGERMRLRRDGTVIN